MAIGLTLPGGLTSYQLNQGETFALQFGTAGGSNYRQMFRYSGLPPGIAPVDPGLGLRTQPGVHFDEITGEPTTPGTYQVLVEVFDVVVGLRFPTVGNSILRASSPPQTYQLNGSTYGYNIGNLANYAGADPFGIWLDYMDGAQPLPGVEEGAAYYPIPVANHLASLFQFHLSTTAGSLTPPPGFDYFDGGYLGDLSLWLVPASGGRDSATIEITVVRTLPSSPTRPRPPLESSHSGTKPRVVWNFLRDSEQSVTHKSMLPAMRDLVRQADIGLHLYSVDGLPLHLAESLQVDEIMTDDPLSVIQSQSPPQWFDADGALVDASGYNIFEPNPNLKDYAPNPISDALWQACVQRWSEGDIYEIAIFADPFAIYVKTSNLTDSWLDGSNDPMIKFVIPSNIGLAGLLKLVTGNLNYLNTPLGIDSIEVTTKEIMLSLSDANYVFVSGPTSGNWTDNLNASTGISIFTFAGTQSAIIADIDAAIAGGNAVEWTMADHSRGKYTLKNELGADLEPTITLDQNAVTIRGIPQVLEVILANRLSSEQPTIDAVIALQVEQRLIVSTNGLGNSLLTDYTDLLIADFSVVGQNKGWGE